MTNIPYKFVCQLCLCLAFASHQAFGVELRSVPFSASKPSLSRSVIGVIDGGSKEQVVGIDAGGIVAGMADQDADGIHSVKFAGKPVRSDLFATKRDCPVTLAVSCAYPFPARIGKEWVFRWVWNRAVSIDAAPESLTERFLRNKKNPWSSLSFHTVQPVS